MMKVEAVVVRDRVETVMEAVEAATGHVGVTVIEAVGHGKEKGITHEYRGRVFESRFLPKALMTFVVATKSRAASWPRSSTPRAPATPTGDGICWSSPVANVIHNRTGAKLEEVEGMSLKEVGFAASTIWVILAAILVIFMQAGFAFLEAGLTRMKNVGHIAAKNVLILAIASIVYYCVGFGLAFGDGGNGIVGGSGFFPTRRRAAHDRAVTVLVVQRDSGRRRLPLRGRLRGRLARDRLGRHGRAHAALGVLRLRRRASR